MATRMTERQQLAIAMRESMASAPVVPVVPVALTDDKENSPPPTVSARHRAARRAATQKTQNTLTTETRPSCPSPVSRARPPTRARAKLPSRV